jgi:release factor glutamine methyltransferase
VTRAAATLGAALAATRARLAAAGIESAALDARLLLARAAETTPERIVGWPEQALADGAAARLEAQLARRLAREPLARILGAREFWSLDFAVDAATLVPRPETETLVEATLAALGDRARPWRILDLGTGSGCVLLALLSELPAATGLGVDLSAAAVAIARANAASLGLGERSAFRVGDWLADVAGPFDVVVANPPYVATGELAGLAPEIRDFEPSSALDGGPDGLAAFRAIAPGLAAALAPGGSAWFEVGSGQAQAVARILVESGLVDPGVRADLSGTNRVVGARRPP